MITAAEAKKKSNEIKNVIVEEAVDRIISELNKKISIAISVGRNETRLEEFIEFSETLTDVRKYYTSLGYDFYASYRENRHEILVRWN